VTTAAGLRATAKAVEAPPEPKVRAPVLDPTCERLAVKFRWSSHLEQIASRRIEHRTPGNQPLERRAK